ncbi:MAG: lysophospholipid acyltransferase family protein, partial [Planctomycetota bacterium]|nr:lysophospholipid acyltransferase family protein [Planctomycetota bacterium]
MQRSLVQRLWYRLWHMFCRAIFCIGWQMRVRGRRFEPADGGVLVLSNHQSYLDPMLVGVSLDRRLNYLARKTLFNFPPLGWLISSLNGIPLDREGLGLSGVKETLRRLKRGEMVLVFPEGTRCRDGEVGALKPGFVALARRGRVQLLPVGIDGAFDAWPRSRAFPAPSAINIELGQPISPGEIRQFSDDELVAEVERRIRCCHARARMGKRHAAGSRGS